MNFELGAFSLSLSVADLDASRTFYEALGFVVSGGNAKENWLIMRSGDHVIGLFHSMFEGNVMTFNPGWDQHSQALEAFTDVRDIQRGLKDEGVQLMSEVDSAEGPGSLMLADPDGNMILIDQHV